MCLTCSCHQPINAHDDPRNLTYADLAAAAEAAGVSVETAAANLAEAVHTVHTAPDVGALFAAAAGLDDTQ
jgi:hypothetical protein